MVSATSRHIAHGEKAEGTKKEPPETGGFES
jgi:hypothetical protein